MTNPASLDHAVRMVAAWLEGDGDPNPDTATIISLLGQLGITRNDAVSAAWQVRAHLADPMQRADTAPMTVADVIATLSHWPQHAVVEVTTDAGAKTLTDLDVATNHATFTAPVVVLTPAMQAGSLD